MRYFFFWRRGGARARTAHTAWVYASGQAPDTGCLLPPPPNHIHWYKEPGTRPALPKKRVRKIDTQARIGIQLQLHPTESNSEEIHHTLQGNKNQALNEMKQVKEVKPCVPGVFYQTTDISNFKTDISNSNALAFFNDDGSVQWKTRYHTDRYNLEAIGLHQWMML